MLFANKFEKKKYPTSEIASILKATLIVGARALKPSSGDSKNIMGKLEHLNKDCIEKGSEETTPKADKAKEKGDREKGKAKEPKKKKGSCLITVAMFR